MDSQHKDKNHPVLNKNTFICVSNMNEGLMT